MAKQVEGRQWRITELVFQAAQPHENPAAVDLTAEFTGPANEALAVAGFWDGGNTWRVRFAPTAPGTWRYRMTCNRADDPGLHGCEGTLAVAPAAGDNPLFRHGGFLKVSADQRYLTHTDGTPFFWLGDTWWFCPSDKVPFTGSTKPGVPSMFKLLVDTRRAQGYTVAHLALLGKLTVTGRDSGVDGQYSALFANKIEPAYWQAVDDYFRYANDAGIVPVIGFGFHTGLNTPTAEQLEQLWRYVLARYGAFATTWLICGEYNLSSGEDPAHPGQRTFTDVDGARVAKLLRVGQFIKDHDPYRRAMTVHPWWYGGEQRQAHDQPWYDFILLQGGHGEAGPPPQFYLDLYRRQPTKPVLEGECTYEGIFGFSDTVVRRNAYKAIQCGSFGFTYGAQGLWYPTQDEKDKTFSEWGECVPWWVALARPGGAQLRHLRAAYESVDWWKLAPADVTWQADPKPATDAKMPLPLAKAEGDRTYFVYVPPQPAAGTRFGFAAAAKGDYAVTVINPRTGETRRQDQPLAPERGTLWLPALSDAQDWVIILRRAAP